MAKCFVMMPITTPGLVATDYGDNDHFVHILQHLFIPAIEKAGYEAVPPAAKGSDLIQAHIIRNIQSADLVLCDITSLNANVFFELGVRTALNLPAVVVKDKKTLAIPFDTGIVNHHTYDGSMSPWTLGIEIDQLSQHIVTVANSAAGSNPLWQYFGLAVSAQPAQGSYSAEDKLDYALRLLESLKPASTVTHVSPTLANPDSDSEAYISVAQSMAKELNAKFVDVKIEGDKVTLDLGDYLLTEELEKSILTIAPNYGVVAEIVGKAHAELFRGKANKTKPHD